LAQGFVSGDGGEDAQGYKHGYKIKSLSYNHGHKVYQNYQIYTKWA